MVWVAFFDFDDCLDGGLMGLLSRFGALLVMEVAYCSSIAEIVSFLGLGRVAIFSSNFLFIVISINATNI